MLSASPFAHRALDQMLPLCDALVALFFVTVGVLINPRYLLSSPQFLLAILLLVMVGKFIVWTAAVKLFRYPLTTAILVGRRAHPDQRVFFHPGAGGTSEWSG